MIKTNSIFLLILLAHSATASNLYPPTQSYLPKLLITEPRFATDSLTSLDVQISRGAATKSRNSSGSTVPLFDIYGTQRIPNLLAFSLDATFKITQILLNYTQNLESGFFLTAALPLRHLAVKNIQFLQMVTTPPDIFLLFWMNTLPKRDSGAHEFAASDLLTYFYMSVTLIPILITLILILSILEPK